MNTAANYHMVSLSSAPHEVESDSLLDPQRIDTDQHPLGHSDDSSDDKCEAAGVSDAVIQEDLERTVGLRWSLVLPTLAVVLFSAGISTAFLLWFLKHEISRGTALWLEDAFLLDEGTKFDADGTASGARLMGLTISTIASHGLSITTPTLMTLVAFRTGAVFLAATRAADLGDDRGLPTPLQFGLLADLLGGLNVMSIYRSTRYFVRSARARIPFCLKEAFLVGLLVFVVSYGVSAMDIWLHTTASTVTSVTNTTLNDPFPFTIAQDTCVLDQANYALYQCGFGGPAGGWMGDEQFEKLVASNLSSDFRAVTLADADDLAVLVVPSPPMHVSFVADTFGARASCTSLNLPCGAEGWDTSDTANNCSVYPFFPPYLRNFTVIGTSAGEGDAYLLTSTCEGCTPALAGPGQEYFVPPLALNPFWVMIQFVWQSTDRNDRAFAELSSDFLAVMQDYTVATLLENCSLSFSNVSVAYSEGNYTVTEETLSNPYLTGGLMASTTLGHYASRLLSNFEGLALTSNSTGSVFALLNQELARLAVASATSLTYQGPTRGQSALGTRMLGRYLAAPALLLVALLYLYALLALTIFLRVALSTRSLRIAMRGAPETRVSAVELVQPRLTQTLALAAEMLPAPGTHEERTRRSMKPNALDMYDEGRGRAVERVRIGPHVGTDGATVFGLWKVK